MESEPRFRRIALSNDGEAVLCELENGRAYSMPISALERAEEWVETASPKSVKLIHDQFAAEVRFDNGTTIDFPCDFVLSVCEPSHDWHQGSSRAVSRLGKRIREIRQAKQMTLDDLAARCGIAKPNLSRLENDKVTPRFETLRAVAEGLGIHPALFHPAHAWKRTLFEFGEWRRSLVSHGSGGINVKTTELIDAFLDRKPEHRHARTQLLAHYQASRNSELAVLWVDLKKWSAEKRKTPAPRSRVRV